MARGTRPSFPVRARLLSIGLVASTWFAAAGVALAGVGVWGPSLGPLGGDVTALAFDPHDPSTVYAGADSGAGVFKSSDGGRSWRAVNSGLTGDHATNVEALAVDPKMPSTVYAGTRDGVFRSADGGRRWTATLTGQWVSAVAIDPRRTATVYAGTRGGGVF